MLKSTRIISAMLVYIILFTFASPILLAAKVEVSGGSMFVETINEIDPSVVRVGDTVELVVISDVVVDGKTVIKAGSKVIGTVNLAKEAGMLGAAAEIGFTINSVQAVDNTIIALSAEKRIVGKDNTTLSVGLGIFLCILFLFMKGEEVTIPAHTKLEARIIGTYNIEVK